MVDVQARTGIQKSRISMCPVYPIVGNIIKNTAIPQNKGVAADSFAALVLPDASTSHAVMTITTPTVGTEPINIWFETPTA